VRRQLSAGLPVTERTLPLTGLVTAVLEGGSGPPIVLLHGPAAYGASWIHVIPDLVASHRVIAPDLPGHGASGTFDGTPTINRACGWLDDLIQRTCHVPPTIVGHTLGGSVTKMVTVLSAVLALTPTVGRADVVLEWNAIMVALVQDQPPPNMNRLAAITHLAVFEAVNAVTGEHVPYLGTVPPARGASAEAAAVSAAHAVLRHYLPDRATSLDAARAQSLAQIPDGSAKHRGIAVGDTAAAQMIVARTNDGSEPPEFYLPSSANPGEWQLTPGCPPAGGVFLHWRNVRPFALRRGDQFRSDPPPALNSARYTRDYKEVQAVGTRDSTERPLDRANVAKLYAAIGDAILWNPIARQLAEARRDSLSRNTRSLALLNIALSDAGVAVLDTKYHYSVWRPETAIVAVGTDGNEKTEPEASYVPFIATPCFPSYPSGHASTSYAAREVLERIFGKRGHAITVSSLAEPAIVLKYTRLKDITSDIDDARVYGGIHFRFDQEGGVKSAATCTSSNCSRYAAADATTEGRVGENDRVRVAGRPAVNRGGHDVDSDQTSILRNYRQVAITTAAIWRWCITRGSAFTPMTAHRECSDCSIPCSPVVTSSLSSGAAAVDSPNIS
jgi:pimeloyl-ACP methyl ester carboxylesterase